MAEVGRVLAFLFMCAVVGMLEYAALKVGVRAVRASRQAARAWRDRRRDSRLLRSYEPEVRHLDDAWRGEL